MSVRINASKNVRRKLLVRSSQVMLLKGMVKTTDNYAVNLSAMSTPNVRGEMLEYLEAGRVIEVRRGGDFVFQVVPLSGDVDIDKVLVVTASGLAGQYSSKMAEIAKRNGGVIAYGEPGARSGPKPFGLIKPPPKS